MQTEAIITSIGITSWLALSAMLFPLLSFLLIILGSCLPLRLQLNKLANKLSVTAIALSFIASLLLLLLKSGEAYHSSITWFFIKGNLISAPLIVKAGLLIDNLSAGMLVLVSFISLLVQVYSIAYMKGEEYYHRYWAYLSLFCFSMLALVVSDNLFLLFVFWELVGLSSYLLIGFWFKNERVGIASLKALLVNKIGDVCLFIGIMMVFAQLGTTDFLSLNSAIASTGMSGNWLSWMGIFIFIGAMAKSAQFPFQVWLSDAMEGPTAISALIHAATMVAAGVFLMVRVFPILNSDALLVITLVGSITALLGALIAAAQFDIKKVLAFSTVSQLGFMMMGIGVGAYHASLFHLFTHAIFKCLLFLCAGAVMMYLKKVKEQNQTSFDEQDMRSMGGLRTLMPITFICYLFAAAALAGIPFFSGFLSKEALLLSIGHWAVNGETWRMIISGMAFIASAITAFYISRQALLLFAGTAKFEIKTPIKEASRLMLIPMIILAVLTPFIWYSINPFSISSSWPLNIVGSQITEIEASWIIPLITLLQMLFAIGLAFYLYRKGKLADEPGNFMQRFLFKQGYFDELYQLIFVKPVLVLSKAIQWFDLKIIDGILHGFTASGLRLAQWTSLFDNKVVDGLVNGIATGTIQIGLVVRKVQTGKIQQYISFILIGIVLVFILIQYF